MLPEPRIGPLYPGVGTPAACACAAGEDCDRALHDRISFRATGCLARFGLARRTETTACPTRVEGTQVTATTLERPSRHSCSAHDMTWCCAFAAVWNVPPGIVSDVTIQA